MAGQEILRRIRGKKNREVRGLIVDFVLHGPGTKRLLLL